MIVHKCKKCGNTITQESIDSKNSEVQKEQDQQEIDKDNPLYQIIQSTTDERVKEHFLELLRSQKFGPCQSCQQRTSLDDNTYAFNTDNPTQDISWPKDIYLKSDRYPHYILAYRKSFIIFIAGCIISCIAISSLIALMINIITIENSNSDSTTGLVVTFLMLSAFSAAFIFMGIPDAFYKGHIRIHADRIEAKFSASDKNLISFPRNNTVKVEYRISGSENHINVYKITMTNQGQQPVTVVNNLFEPSAFFLCYYLQALCEFPGEPQKELLIRGWK